MTDRKIHWTADLNRPAGKGATVQRFTASDGADRLEIDTTPWGDGDLKVNDTTIAHVTDTTDAGMAFRELEEVAEKVEQDRQAGAAADEPADTAERTATDATVRRPE